MNRFRDLILTILPSLLAIVLSFVVGSVFILIVGKDPFEVFGKFFS